MNNKNIANGVWPVMLTAFKDSCEIDYNGVESLIEWYLSKNISGLFANCLSSEMFHLSMKERRELTDFIVKKVNGRVPVVASGNITYTTKEQIEEIKMINDCGVDAVILVTNRLAPFMENDEVWKKNAEKILKETHNIPLGLYECPDPYKKIVSGELTAWCEKTGRFVFLKDTTCDLKMIKEKADKLSSNNLKLFNANAATLLSSLKLGAAGYSGVLANIIPDKLSKLVRMYDEKDSRAQKLQNFITTVSMVERQFYPVNAKYFLSLEGVKISPYCRKSNYLDFSETGKLEIEQLREIITNFDI